MPAYVIVETDITDPERYEQYTAASPAAIAAGGGRFLVRGGELVVLEGDWQPSRLVLLEFEDLAAAKRACAWSPCRASSRGPTGAPSPSILPGGQPVPLGLAILDNPTPKSP